MGHFVANMGIRLIKYIDIEFATFSHDFWMDGEFVVINHGEDGVKVHEGALGRNLNGENAGKFGVVEEA